MDKIIYLNIPFKRIITETNKDGSTSTKMFLRVSDCIGKVSDDSKKIAELGGGLGGIYTINYYLKEGINVYAETKDIWNAYCDAMGLLEQKI